MIIFALGIKEGKKYKGYGNTKWTIKKYDSVLDILNTQHAKSLTDPVL